MPESTRSVGLHSRPHFDPKTGAMYLDLVPGDEVDVGDECSLLRGDKTVPPEEWTNFVWTEYRPVSERMLGHVVTAKSMLRFRRPLDSFRRRANRLATLRG